MVIYHIWNFYNFGFDSFRVFRPDMSVHPSFESKLLAVVVYLSGNLINYIFQVILPIIFLYFGFMYKGEQEQEQD